MTTVTHTMACHPSLLLALSVSLSIYLSSHCSNRAACSLKLGQPESALEDAKRCSDLNPNFVKGFFRQGLALHALERYVKRS